MKTRRDDPLEVRLARAKKRLKESRDEYLAKTPEEQAAEEQKEIDAFPDGYSLGSYDPDKYYDEEMDGPVPLDGQIVIDEHGNETVYTPDANADK